MVLCQQEAVQQQQVISYAVSDQHITPQLEVQSYEQVDQYPGQRYASAALQQHQQGPHHDILMLISLIIVPHLIHWKQQFTVSSAELAPWLLNGTSLLLLRLQHLQVLG